MDQKNERSSLEFLKDWGGGLTNWTEKWIPDALVIVWILTVIAFIFALIWGDVGPTKAVSAWGKGFWVLLTFGMQMCLIMMTGYILACSPPVKKLLDWLSSLPNTEKPWQAIMVMSLFSMIVAWFNWGLSLISSAMLALFMVKNNPKVDYRLLVAGAYLGLGCTWHSGLSASAPLLVNTPDNFLIKGGYLTETISTSQTIFTPFNIILLLIVIVVVTLLMSVMHPSEEKTYKVKPELMDQLKLYESPEKPAGKLSPSLWLNWWPGWNIIIAAAGFWWLGKTIGEIGFGKAINLNNINLFFLMLGILFHWRPWSFLKATEEAGKAVWGIVIQFPFYAGIFGLFKYTALATAFTNAFVAVCSGSTFLLVVYWYAGLLNYLIPSGGSEWAVTAPYLLPAAKQLGVAANKVVIAYGWGDMMTDMIQPFWAIAMLAVAKLEFREIMGWLLLVFGVFFVITSIAFLLLPIF
ncbi:MAG: short-chain fatty acid transporter [Deltaproteobacteria bacterium]|nr:short-chain fatty acid transporter [Deltaproteobacteria bacterium]